MAEGVELQGPTIASTRICLAGAQVAARLAGERGGVQQVEYMDTSAGMLERARSHYEASSSGPKPWPEACGTLVPVCVGSACCELLRALLLSKGRVQHPPWARPHLSSGLGLATVLWPCAFAQKGGGGGRASPCAGGYGAAQLLTEGLCCARRPVQLTLTRCDPGTEALPLQEKAYDGEGWPWGEIGQSRSHRCWAACSAAAAQPPAAGSARCLRACLPGVRCGQVTAVSAAAWQRAWSMKETGA